MPDAGFTLGSYQKFIRFEKKEVIELFIGALVMGFVVSFARWGDGATADLLVGFRNLLIGVLMSIVVLFVFSFASKVAAVKKGYLARFKISYGMVIASLVITFLTYGAIWFFPIGGITMETERRLRIGMFRYQFNLKEQSNISFFGPFGVLKAAFAIKILAILTNFAFIPKPMLLDFLKISVLFAIFVMLPFPSLNGLHIFFDRPGKYFMFFGATVGLSIAIFFIDNIFLSLLVALIFAALFLFLGSKLMDSLNAVKKK